MSVERGRELERLIEALDPDQIRGPTLDAAKRLALSLCDTTCANLAAVIARTLGACHTGEVEPHHAKWRLASAAQALTQQLERAAGGAIPSHTALDGACYELAVMFPPAAGAAPPPAAQDVDLIHPHDLVRKPEQ